MTIESRIAEIKERRRNVKPFRKSEAPDLYNAALRDIDFLLSALASARGGEGAVWDEVFSAIRGIKNKIGSDAMIHVFNALQAAKAASLTPALGDENLNSDPG